MKEIMGFFPFFVDLADKEGLIIGGGTVAWRKIEKLRPYGPRLTVAALTFSEEIEHIEGVVLLRQTFQTDMLDGKYFAIAATDDSKENHEISRLCQERNILVNVVDDKDACTFLFPSLVKKGRLSIGISTQGASPSAAIHIKEQLNQWIPENFDDILEFLERKRPTVKRVILEEGRRSELFSRMFMACMDKGRRLTEEEFEEMLSDCLHDRMAAE